jgi:hypothetical protein
MHTYAKLVGSCPQNRLSLPAGQLDRCEAWLHYSADTVQGVVHYRSSFAKFYREAAHDLRTFLRIEIFSRKQKAAFPINVTRKRCARRHRRRGERHETRRLWILNSCRARRRATPPADSFTRTATRLTPQRQGTDRLKLCPVATAGAQRCVRQHALHWQIYRKVVVAGVNDCAICSFPAFGSSNPTGTQCDS